MLSIGSVTFEDYGGTSMREEEDGAWSAKAKERLTSGARSDNNQPEAVLWNGHGRGE